MEEKILRCKEAERQLDIVQNEANELRIALSKCQTKIEACKLLLQDRQYERLRLVSPLLVSDILALFANHLKRAKDLQSFCLTCKAWNEAVADNATLLIEQRQWKVTFRQEFLALFRSVWVQGPSGIIVRATRTGVEARPFDDGLWLVEYFSQSDPYCSVASVENGRYLLVHKTRIEVRVGPVTLSQTLSTAPVAKFMRRLKPTSSNDLKEILSYFLSFSQLNDYAWRLGAAKEVISDSRFPKLIRTVLTKWDKRLA